MRFAGLLLFPGSLLVVAAVACSSVAPSGLAPDDGTGAAAGDTAANGTGSTPASTGTKSNTCLGKVGLDFEKPACNTCMSADGCCQATIACFKGNPDCAALQTCMSTCGGTGTGTGAGTGPGTGADGGAGAGNTVAASLQRHAAT